MKNVGVQATADPIDFHCMYKKKQKKKQTLRICICGVMYDLKGTPRQAIFSLEPFISMKMVTSFMRGLMD